MLQNRGWRAKARLLYKDTDEQSERITFIVDNPIKKITYVVPLYDQGKWYFGGRCHMKLDRLIGILTVLLKSDKTTAPELAQRFEVSSRIILRDLDSLCLAGIPIVTTHGGDGGIAIMEGYKINKSVLTADELQSLVAGLKSIDSVSRQSNFESLMLKLAPDNNAVVSLTDSVVIDLSS
jgi:hypothetical protein